MREPGLIRFVTLPAAHGRNPPGRRPTAPYGSGFGYGLLAVVLCGPIACADDGESARDAGDPPAALEHDGSREGSEHGESGEHGAEGEHRGDGEDAAGGEGEESGDHVARDATWDAARRGLRLRLAFDAARSAFAGTVENTTGETVCAVRVEVHLSGGIELGPTERTDLAPGESVAVELPAGTHAFETWTAHPEQSSCPGYR